jgi:hypothetical protein
MPYPVPIRKPRNWVRVDAGCDRGTGDICLCGFLFKIKKKNLLFLKKKKQKDFCSWGALNAGCQTSAFGWFFRVWVNASDRLGRPFETPPSSRNTPRPGSNGRSCCETAPIGTPQGK